jgi:hypothetical protein
MKNGISWKECRNQGQYNISRLLYKKMLLNVSMGKPHFMRFLLYDFTLTWFKNSHHFSNLCDNFQIKSSKHGWSMTILVICSRLARSDISVMPSLTCMNWLLWWHNRVAHLHSSSTELTISEKHKSISLSTLPAKNQQKTFKTEEKVDVMSWLHRGEQILTYAMFDLLIVAYIQFLIMLIDLKKCSVFG